jgi:hypothetical protein
MFPPLVPVCVSIPCWWGDTPPSARNLNASHAVGGRHRHYSWTLRAGYFPGMGLEQIRVELVADALTMHGCRDQRWPRGRGDLPPRPRVGLRPPGRAVSSANATTSSSRWAPPGGVLRAGSGR